MVTIELLWPHTCSDQGDYISELMDKPENSGGEIIIEHVIPSWSLYQYLMFVHLFLFHSPRWISLFLWGLQGMLGNWKGLLAQVKQMEMECVCVEGGIWQKSNGCGFISFPMKAKKQHLPNSTLGLTQTQLRTHPSVIKICFHFTSNLTRSTN